MACDLPDRTPGLESISVPLARAALRSPELLASLTKKALATARGSDNSSDPMHKALESAYAHLGLEEWGKSQVLADEKVLAATAQHEGLSADEAAMEFARQAAQLQSALRAALVQFLAMKSTGLNTPMSAGGENVAGKLTATFVSGDEVQLNVFESSTVADMQEAIAGLKLLPVSILHLVGPDGQCLQPEQNVLEAAPQLSCSILICDHAIFEVGDRVRAQWSNGYTVEGETFEEAWYNGQVEGFWYEGAPEHKKTHHERLTFDDVLGLLQVWEKTDVALESMGCSETSDFDAVKYDVKDALGRKISLDDEDEDWDSFNYPVTMEVTFTSWESGEPRYRINWTEDDSYSIVRREGTTWRTSFNGVIYVMEKVAG